MISRMSAKTTALGGNAHHIELSFLTGNSQNNLQLMIKTETEVTDGYY